MKAMAIGAAGVGVMVLALPVGIVLVLAPASSGSCTVTPGDPGKWTAPEMTQLWIAHHGSAATTDVTGMGPVPDPEIAGAVGMAESAGDPTIQNSIGASGLWQIHPPQGGWENPDRNAAMAVRKFNDSKIATGHGWLPWEAFTGRDGRGDDGPWRSFLAGGSGAAPATSCTGGGPVSGSPKSVIDTIVLPLARANGIDRTVAENDAANAAHGPTVSGGESDHQGPPDVAWAADMSNGVTTPQEDALAAALAERFAIPWSGSGLVSATHDGYRFQLIYRINTPQAGDHFNHVHFGVRRTP